MIKRIAETNKVDPIDYFQTVQMLKGDSGELEVSSVDYTFSLITTPNDKEVWSQKQKSRDNQDNNPQPETDQITVTSWLPESV